MRWATCSEPCSPPGTGGVRIRMSVQIPPPVYFATEAPTNKEGCEVVYCINIAISDPLWGSCLLDYSYRQTSARSQGWKNACRAGIVPDAV